MPPRSWCACALALLACASGCRHSAPAPARVGAWTLVPAGTALADDLGYALAWAPDGRWLAAVHLDGQQFRLSVLDAPTLVVRNSWPLGPAEHDISALCVSPDGQTVVSGGDDGRVQAFSPAGTPVWQHAVSAAVSACAWSGSRVAVLGRNGAAWVLEGGVPVASGSTGHGRANALRTLPEGRLATAGDDGCVRTWRLEGAALVRESETRVGGALNSVREMEGGWLVARSAAPAVRTPSLYARERSGQYLEPSADNAAVWWDGHGARPFPGHRAYVVDAAWSAPADAVLSVGWDNRLQVQPRVGGAGSQAVELPWLGQRVVPSPDGTQVAVLGWAHPPRPWHGTEAALALFRWEPR